MHLTGGGGKSPPPSGGGIFFLGVGFKKFPGGEGITFGIFRKWKKIPPPQRGGGDFFPSKFSPLKVIKWS